MKYEPKKNTINFEIGELSFEVDPMRAQAKASKIQQTLKDAVKGVEGELVNDEILEKMLKSGKKCIDLLLGEGASDKIFDKSIDYYSVMDLYFFISAEVNKKCAEKKAEYETSTK